MLKPIGYLILSFFVTSGTKYQNHIDKFQSDLTTEFKNKVVKIDAFTTQKDSIKRYIAQDFTNRLKTGEKLSSLVNNVWSFIYNEYDRCSGSTYGKVSNQSNLAIDNELVLKVKNDSNDAWACEKKAPYYYEMKFDLQEKLRNWDRFELQNNEYSDTPKKELNSFYILGAGESDYIKITIDSNNLISSIKYSIEDPG